MDLDMTHVAICGFQFFLPWWNFNKEFGGCMLWYFRIHFSEQGGL